MRTFWVSDLLRSLVGLGGQGATQQLSLLGCEPSPNTSLWPRPGPRVAKPWEELILHGDPQGTELAQ